MIRAMALFENWSSAHEGRLKFSLHWASRRISECLDARSASFWPKTRPKLQPLAFGSMSALLALMSPALLMAQETRLLDCKTVFPPDVSAAQLAVRFGAANVTKGQVWWSEGYHEMGTFLFAGTPDQFEIMWQDSVRQEKPKRLFVRGNSSRWHTETGLAMDVDLKTIERLNKGPFCLAGFDWDYAGTIVSWLNGALQEALGAACTIFVRLSPYGPNWTADMNPLANQVQGDGRFSSEHQAMQAINPPVYELVLRYPKLDLQGHGCNL